MVPSEAAPPVASRLSPIDHQDGHELKHTWASTQMSEPGWLAPLMGEVAALIQELSPLMGEFASIRKGHEELRQAQLDIHDGQQQLTLELRQAAPTTGSSAATLTPAVVNHGVAELVAHPHAALAEQACDLDVQRERLPASSKSHGVAEAAPLVTASRAAPPVVVPPSLLSLMPCPVPSQLPFFDRENKDELQHVLASQHISEPVWLTPLIGEAAALRECNEELRRTQLELQEVQQQLILELRQAASIIGSSNLMLSPGVVNHFTAECAVQPSMALVGQAGSGAQQEILRESIDSLPVAETACLGSAPASPLLAAPSPMASHPPTPDRQDKHESKSASSRQKVSPSMWVAPSTGDGAALRQGRSELRQAQLDIHEGQQQLIRGQQHLAERMEQLAIQTGQADLRDKRELSSMSNFTLR